ncbi:hypothetical protein MHYP_G00207830 [Metynnis hypsauchen]
MRLDLLSSIASELNLPGTRFMNTPLRTNLHCFLRLGFKPLSAPGPLSSSKSLRLPANANRPPPHTSLRDTREEVYSSGTCISCRICEYNEPSCKGT